MLSWLLVTCLSDIRKFLFTEMCLVYASKIHMIFPKSPVPIACYDNRKAKFSTNVTNHFFEHHLTSHSFMFRLSV